VSGAGSAVDESGGRLERQQEGGGGGERGGESVLALSAVWTDVGVGVMLTVMMVVMVLVVVMVDVGGQTLCVTGGERKGDALAALAHTLAKTTSELSLKSSS